MDKIPITLIKADGDEIVGPDLSISLESGDTVYIGKKGDRDEYERLAGKSKKEALFALKCEMAKNYTYTEITKGRKEIDHYARELVNEYNKTKIPEEEEYVLAYLMPGKYRKAMEEINEKKCEILNNAFKVVA